jgi:hypothetical protein
MTIRIQHHSRKTRRHGRFLPTPVLWRFTCNTREQPRRRLFRQSTQIVPTTRSMGMRFDLWNLRCRTPTRTTFHDITPFVIWTNPSFRHVHKVLLPRFVSSCSYRFLCSPSSTKVKSAIQPVDHKTTRIQFIVSYKYLNATQILAVNCQIVGWVENQIDFFVRIDVDRPQYR